MKEILSRNWPHPNLWLETWSYFGTCTWILITPVLTLQIWQTGKNFWKMRENLLSLSTFSKIWQLIIQVCTFWYVPSKNFFELGNVPISLVDIRYFIKLQIHTEKKKNLQKKPSSPSFALKKKSINFFACNIKYLISANWSLTHWGELISDGANYYSHTATISTIFSVVIL